MALGGVLFLLLLARPLTDRLEASGTSAATPSIASSVARIAGYAALALLLSEAATVALQAAVLIDTVDLQPRHDTDRRLRHRRPGQNRRRRRDGLPSA